jgi:hypothetical protein
MTYALVFITAGIVIAGYPTLETCEHARTSSGWVHRNAVCVPTPKDATINVRQRQ